MKKRGLLVLTVGLIFLAQDARADKRLTWTSSYSYHPAIAIDSNWYLNVVWDDFTPTNWEIFFKRSTDMGATWTANRRITWTSNSSAHPAIAVGWDDILHVVWEEGLPGNEEIFYKISEDGGATWSAGKRLSSSTGSSLLPSLVANSGGMVHVVWQDDAPGNSEIYYKKSTDHGISWSPSRRLTWNAGNSQYPVLAMDPADNLYLVWTDDTSGSREVYFRQSWNAGDTWTTTKRLTWLSGLAVAPDIVADSIGELHIVWEDALPSREAIYYKRTQDWGTRWEVTKRLSWTAGHSQEPSLGIDSDDNPRVVWSDDSSGNKEIYYRKSTNLGADWTAAQRITSTSGVSSQPVIAIDVNGELNLIWSDDTPGNYELYYQKRS